MTEKVREAALLLKRTGRSCTLFVMATTNIYISALSLCRPGPWTSPHNEICPESSWAAACVTGRGSSLGGTPRQAEEVSGKGENRG